MTADKLHIDHGILEDSSHTDDDASTTDRPYISTGSKAPRKRPYLSVDEICPSAKVPKTHTDDNGSRRSEPLVALINHDRVHFEPKPFKSIWTSCEQVAARDPQSFLDFVQSMRGRWEEPIQRGQLKQGPAEQAQQLTIEDLKDYENDYEYFKIKEARCLPIAGLQNETWSSQTGSVTIAHGFQKNLLVVNLDLFRPPATYNVGSMATALDEFDWDGYVDSLFDN